MFGFDLKSMLPKSFTAKNGLIVLCKHIEDHENVKHEVRRFEMRININKKTFDILIFHPGTKAPTFANDVLDDGLWYPVKYELERHSHWYHFSEGAFLIGLIRSMVESEVKTKDAPDYVIVRYDDTLTEIPCEIYVTQSDGKKVVIKHSIK